MYRAFRVKATGQWCEPLHEDAHFGDVGEKHADRVAATLGLAPGSLEAVDGLTDPRSGVLLKDPNVTQPAPPLPPNPLLARIAALEAKIAALEARP